MGYPGDNDQPPWDSTPPETDPWSRHPLSAPVSQPQPDGQDSASWHGSESGSTSWAQEQPAQGGSWLEGTAAQPPAQNAGWGENPQATPAQPGAAEAAGQSPWQSPRPAEWQESQQPSSWQNDPLSAPPPFNGPSTGAQAAFNDSAGGWPDSPLTKPERPGTPLDGPLDGPSGPQATPWHDGAQPFDGNTGGGTQALSTFDLPSYDAPSYDQQSNAQPAPPFSAPAGGLSAQPFDGNTGGTQALPSYDMPSYDSPSYDGAPSGALAAQPFGGAQEIQPQATWQEPPYDGRSGPMPVMPDAPGEPGGYGGQDGPPQPYDGFSGPQSPPQWGQPENDSFGPGEQPWSPDGGQPGHELDETGGGRKPLLLGIVGLACLVAVGGGAYLYLKKDNSTQKNASSSSALTPTPDKTEADPEVTSDPSSQPSPGGRLASRKTDSKPLTLDEIFHKKKFTEKGITYVMTVKKKTACKAGVHGTALQAALVKGKCTQFLRATFATSGGKLIGTVGVANLATAAAATKAAKAATAKDAYVVALPAKGITSKIGQGDALGAAWTRGHYLIMTWVQLPNGKTIPAKAKKAARVFAQSTVTGSGLGPALYVRDETSKPGG